MTDQPGKKRKSALRVIIPLSIVAALLSLVFALLIRFEWPCLRSYGYVILGLWTIGPPLWFMWEWNHSLDLPHEEKRDIEHWHELARNLWLALIIVLSATMGIVFKAE